MSDEIPPCVPVAITKHGDSDVGVSPATWRPYMAQVITNPKLRADGETRDDALRRLKGVLRAHFFCSRDSNEFEIVNMDLNEILVEEVMGG